VVEFQSVERKIKALNQHQTTTIR